MSGLNQLRIIAGSHRHRVISFPNGDGLRPTGDRVRETLFNWLEPVVVGTNCLDLFAGSGALSFESLSRGARSTTLLDTDRRVVMRLKENAALLGFTKAQVIQAEACEWLNRGLAGDPFDIVFVDPPFRGNLLYKCCNCLTKSKSLAEGARVYLEHHQKIDNSKLPAGWLELKAKSAGRVFFSLYLVNPKL
tara:strand:- start:302 stop:874 length:573 start_codon:yes stop_codon:yes gene_type:complete